MTAGGMHDNAFPVIEPPTLRANRILGCRSRAIRKSLMEHADQCEARTRNSAQNAAKFALELKILLTASGSSSPTASGSLGVDRTDADR